MARSRKPVAVKAAKTKDPHPCACTQLRADHPEVAEFLATCDAMTKGTWAVGHDARAHGAMRKAGLTIKHAMPEDKRAAHAAKLRAKRAAQRELGEQEADARAARAAEHEQMDADGVTPLAKAPKVTVRRRKGAQAQEAVA